MLRDYFDIQLVRHCGPRRYWYWVVHAFSSARHTLDNRLGLLTYEGEVVWGPSLDSESHKFFSREEAERAIVRFALRSGG